MPALKEAPNLKPCPFCGNELQVKWDRPNPSARCATDGCIALQMSCLSLDVPGVIEAWNTRAEPEITQEALSAIREGKAALDAQAEPPVACYPCEIVKADFEENTVTVEMLVGNYIASAGIKYLCDTAPVQQVDLADIREAKAEIASNKQTTSQGESQNELNVSNKQEPLVRFCPGCGSIGEVDSKYRDCCPDGNKARIVPSRFAEECQGLFNLAIGSVVPVMQEPVTIEAAEKMGATGVEPTEAERLLFEAWMKGHCWAICGKWDGKTYVGTYEYDDIHPYVMATRGLWAAWRDRAALAGPQQVCLATEIDQICAAIKAEDDYCVDQGDYMLDSNDCIKIIRGEWIRPDFELAKPKKLKVQNESC